MKLLRGFSIPELMITIAIIAITATLALPGYLELVEVKRGDKALFALARAVSLGRSTAIKAGRMVTICRSEDGLSCAGSWSKGSIVFTDRNADRVVNQDDRIVYRLQLTSLSGSIRWRAFQNRQYLQITRLGFTRYQNGNFTWCPANGNLSWARQLIISRSGRARFARDTNGDGIQENSQGQPLSC